jgi:hypothetical protein
MSADRFKQAAKANDSGSWNKYSYTRGDPVNRADPSGANDCDPNYCITVTDSPDPGSGGDGQKGKSGNQGNDPSNQLPTLGGASSSQQKQFQKAAQQAIALIRKVGSDCNKDFGGEKGVAALDNAAFFYGTTDALSSVGRGAAAQTNSSLNTIIISSIGWFFNSVQTQSNGTTIDYGASTGLSGTNLQAFVLLHELGHLTGLFGSTDEDGSGPKAQENQDANNTKILQDCFGKQYKPVQ